MWYGVAVITGCCLAGTGASVPLASADYNPCGPNALYVCARMSRLDVDRQRLIELCQPDSNGGCTAADLVRAARAIGFPHAAAVQTTVAELSRLRVPVIVQDNQRNPPHFLAVVGQREDHFLVVNTPGGQRWLSKEQAAQGWNGYAVLLADSPIPGLEVAAFPGPSAQSSRSAAAGFAVGALAGIAAGVIGWRLSPRRLLTRP